MSDYCSGRLAVSQLLNLVAAISLQMRDKICTPHICIPLNDVRQNELIVDIIVITRQIGESIPHSIVRKDTLFDPGDDVSIVVRQHNFQC